MLLISGKIQDVARALDLLSRVYGKTPIARKSKVIDLTKLDKPRKVAGQRR